MARIAMPDGACVGVTIAGSHTGREATYSGRIVDVDNSAHAKALRDIGGWDVTCAGRVQAPGYPCRSCGFDSLFVRCKCGASNPRKDTNGTRQD